MRGARLIARTIAGATAVLGLVAMLGPLGELWDTVYVYLDPHFSFDDLGLSGREALRRDAGNLLGPCLAIGFAALLWLVADMHKTWLQRPPATPGVATEPGVAPARNEQNR